MSSNKHTPDQATQINAARTALRRLTSEIDALDGRAAQYFDIHRTDLHCLDVIASRGPVTPSDLAQATSLTSGGMSIALDRLERAGLAQRIRNPNDRRSVLVEATEQTHHLSQQFFGPLARIETKLLAQHDQPQLHAIHTFLNDLATALAQHRPQPNATQQKPSSEGPGLGTRRPQSRGQRASGR